MVSALPDPLLRLPLFMRRLIVSALRALLPSSDDPQAAIIEIDLDSGTITKVASGSDLTGFAQVSDVEVLRLGDEHVLLPGLMERVLGVA